MDMFALFNHEIPDTLQEEQTIKDFEFDVELDMEDNVMETLELPEIFLGRYMHDFKINQTVIVDTLAKRCFLMKLDRNLIPAPRSIYEILAKMRNGAFDIDYEEIRKVGREVKQIFFILSILFYSPTGLMDPQYKHLIDLTEHLFQTSVPLKLLTSELNSPSQFVVNILNVTAWRKSTDLTSSRGRWRWGPPATSSESLWARV